ncbi:hypothetical protein V8F06_007954 [Rhypophila decipiens]
MVFFFFCHRYLLGFYFLCSSSLYRYPGGKFPLPSLFSSSYPGNHVMIEVSVGCLVLFCAFSPFIFPSSLDRQEQMSSATIS